MAQQQGPPKVSLPGAPWASGPALMGIVNVTPDSFSDGGLCLEPPQACAHATQLVADGATLLDVGAESTRPGSTPISVEEELERLLPALHAIVGANLGVPISVDTRRAAVARAALQAGASIVNDVSAETDPEMAALVREAGCTLVLMHGYPAVPESKLAEGPAAAQMVERVHKQLIGRAERLQKEGVTAKQVWLDPGLGFGKTAAQSLALLHHTSKLVAAGYPVLIGPSRKRFLRASAGEAQADALTGTACALAAFQGAHVMRVHAPKVVLSHMALAIRHSAQPSLAPAPLK